MNDSNYTREQLRASNREKFNDTLIRIRNNNELNAAASNSSENTLFYPVNEKLSEPHRKFDKTNIIVSGKRTAEAASGYQGKIAILNFASATTPGGGVITGSSAQEESLCRISTLYPSLAYNEKSRPYYEYNRRSHSYDYSDAMLYIPDVIFFKSDELIPKILPTEKWIKADVITAAAPNLIMEKQEMMTQQRMEELELIFKNRISRIFRIAFENDDETLILGAFGCGAFHNSPAMVAECFRSIQIKYDGAFRNIEYAVFTTKENDLNYRVFKETMGK